ncbi:MFS transporter [Cutibacterium sp. V947]|uniref:MFS transporter n=1 Tax=Cutibacterium sp. V947 TaxID=3446480 RepID=UPI003EE3B754
MSTQDRLTPATRHVVVALVFGAILPLLDTSISNVAIHGLGDSFGTSVAVSQWVISGYGLASTLAIPLSGWATRRFGARRVWLTALSVFTLASALCASAWSIGALIAFRVIQGFATGFSIPIMQTLVGDQCGQGAGNPSDDCDRVTRSDCAAVAPLLGGMLIDTLGWRAISS